MKNEIKHSLMQTPVGGPWGPVGGPWEVFKQRIMLEVSNKHPNINDEKKQISKNKCQKQISRINRGRYTHLFHAKFNFT